MIEVDRPRAIYQALEMIRCQAPSLYVEAVGSVYGSRRDCIDKSTTAGWQLASIVLGILVKDPNSDVTTIAFGKY